MEHQPESESNSESASKSRTPTPGTRPVSSVVLDTNGRPVNRLLIKTVENFYFLFDGFPYVIAAVFFTPAFSIRAIYSCIFHPCIFHSCIFHLRCLLLHFQLLHFPHLHFPPLLSTPAFSASPPESRKNATTAPDDGGCCLYSSTHQNVEQTGLELSLGSVHCHLRSPYSSDIRCTRLTGTH